MPEDCLQMNANECQKICQIECADDPMLEHMTEAIQIASPDRTPGGRMQVAEKSLPGRRSAGAIIPGRFQSR